MSGRALGDGPPSVCTDEAWAEVMRVNLESAFRLLRAAFPAFRRTGGGSFVAVGSVLAEHADPDFLTVAYAVTKAGLRGLVRTAALEGAPDGIRCNTVVPGVIDTPANRAGGAEGGVPPERIARVIAWLCDDASAAVTGAEIPV